MQNKPWFILISGPNGAGKTTFHDRILEQNPFLKNAIFANSDIEYAKLVEQPENITKFQELNTAIDTKTEEIKNKLYSRFKKLMENIGGDLHTRIDKKNDVTKDYWQEQFSLSVHIQPEQEYVLTDMNTYQDLIRNVGGGDIHARINAKADKNNWYKIYKKLVNTIEVQKAIHLYPFKQQIASLEFNLQIAAGITTIKKIDKALESGKNLIFESTGAGNKPRLLIKKAREKYGYSIYSFHPYLLRPELSIARVQHRVENGGHDVPKDVILSRYDSSLNSLANILSLVDFGIVMDNSGKKPYMPIFAQCNGYMTDFAPCPEYLKPTRQQITESFQFKSVAELLHLPQYIDISKLTEEQRENFGHIIISNLINQNIPTATESNEPYISQESKQKTFDDIKNILCDLTSNKYDIQQHTNLTDLIDLDYWGLCGNILSKYHTDISSELPKIKTISDLCNVLCEKVAKQNIIMQAQQTKQR